MNIGYKKTTDFSRGLIIDLLEDAYSFDMRYKQYWEDNWREADDFLFNNRQIAEEYSFVTTLNEVPIGFIVWDPRKMPIYAEIGHNCIRTKHKGNNFGKLQLGEAIRRICKTEVKKIIVTTNEGLIPAQKNYESMGFQLIQKRINVDNPQIAGKYMDYELLI